MKFIIQEQFDKDSDPECTGDYDKVVVLVDGRIEAEYGDHYHDKGADKAEGFIEGWAAAKGVKNPKHKTERVAVEGLYE